MNKRIIITGFLIVVIAGFFWTQSRYQALNEKTSREDLATHLEKWGVRLNNMGLTLSDFSETSNGTLPKETLEAQGENMILNMTRTKTNAPGKYIGDKKFLLESLFLPTTSPYPEVITNVIECPEEFKPKVKETEQGTIYTLFAGERFTYGICVQDLVVYYSAYGIFDCKEKGIFEVRLFSKAKEGPALSNIEGLQPLIQSFVCG